jgi:hypothetical protein
MIKREIVRPIPVIYTDEAIAEIKRKEGFNFDIFEKDYFNEIVISDKVIRMYRSDRKCLKEN